MIETEVGAPKRISVNFKLEIIKEMNGTEEESPKRILVNYEEELINK